MPDFHPASGDQATRGIAVGRFYSHQSAAPPIRRSRTVPRRMGRVCVWVAAWAPGHRLRRLRRDGPGGRGRPGTLPSPRQWVSGKGSRLGVSRIISPASSFSILVMFRWGASRPPPPPPQRVGFESAQPPPIWHPFPWPLPQGPRRRRAVGGADPAGPRPRPFPGPGTPRSLFTPVNLFKK